MIYIHMCADVRSMVIPLHVMTAEQCPSKGGNIEPGQQRGLESLPVTNDSKGLRQPPPCRS
jgi:hypothetical protein